MSKSLFAALLFSAIAAPLVAQDAAIAPGSPLLNTARIRPASDSFTIVTYRNGAVLRTTSLVRSIARVTDRGRAAIVFAQKYHGPDGMTVDTSWIDASTLAPIRYSANLTKEVQQLTFEGLAVKGTVAVKDSAARTIDQTGAESFFNAVPLDGILYAALPLKEGFSAKLLAYNPPRMFLPMTIKVVGREDLKRIDGSTVHALLLSMQTGPAPARVWIDAESGALLRLGFGTGANAFWKVRSDFPVPPPTDP